MPRAKKTEAVTELGTWSDDKDDDEDNGEDNGEDHDQTHMCACELP